VRDQDIGCEQALRQVFDLVDHELNEVEREAMERHLRTCKSCFSKADFERRLKQRLRDLREDTAGPGFSDRIAKLLESF
jgi:anti-sigma factor (TIGR02949 family)